VQLASNLRNCLDRAIENSKTAAHEPSLELV
jgi:hypothetical protein